MTKDDEHMRVVIPADMERYARQGHRLHFITKELVKYVGDKDLHYGSSWRRRGGAGAFFVISRKWDRIEQACETQESAKYDIFNVFKKDDRSETILDDCLDLIGYLLILIEHMVEIGYVTKIEALHMRFILTSPEVRLEPSGMQHPFGFDEKEDSDPPSTSYHPDQVDDPRLPKRQVEE